MAVPTQVVGRNCPRPPHATGVAAKHPHPAVLAARAKSKPHRSQCWGGQTVQGTAGGGEHPSPFAPASCPRSSSQAAAPPEQGVHPGSTQPLSTHLDREQPLVIGEDAVGVDVPLEPGREQTRVPQGSPTRHCGHVAALGDAWHSNTPTPLLREELSSQFWK